MPPPPLRRVLLSSLPGAAITMVKIKGVAHEFSVIPHVLEDVVDIIIAAIEVDNQGAKIFDLGGPYPIRYNEFIKKILQITKKKKSVIKVPLKIVLAIVQFLNLFNKYSLFFQNTCAWRFIFDSHSIDGFSKVSL